MESFNYILIIIIELSIAVLFFGVVILIIMNVVLRGDRKHPIMRYMRNLGVFLSGLGFLGFSCSFLLMLALSRDISVFIVMSCYVIILGLTILGSWTYLRRKS